jgi:sarcosine oxidase, subunit beta
MRTAIYVEGAARLGVHFEYGVECAGFELDGSGRISTLRTSGGDVGAGEVVNAAGAWAAPVARKAGLDLPVEPLRRQAAVTYPFDLLPEEMPMTIFAEDGFHLRVRDGRVLILWPDEPDVADPFETIPFCRRRTKPRTEASMKCTIFQKEAA